MTKKAFVKGQQVTLIGSWDNKGAAYYRNAVVHSCGKVQMVLTDAATGEEMGRHFRPARGDLNTVSAFNWQATFPRMTDEEAIAACLLVGERVVQRQREHLAACRGCRPADSGYVRSLNKSEAELHAPTALCRVGEIVV